MSDLPVVAMGLDMQKNAMNREPAVLSRVSPPTAQLAELEQSLVVESQLAMKASVSPGCAVVAFSVSKYVSPTLPLALTWIWGMNAWTSPGDWSTRIVLLHVSPPSVDCAKVILEWPVKRDRP